MAGGPHDAKQPILLGTDTAADGFDCLMSVDGAAITASEVGLAQRTCILFDGYDDGALNHARGQWKMLSDAGCQAQYWAQVDGILGQEGRKRRALEFEVCVEVFGQDLGCWCTGTKC